MSRPLLRLVLLGAVAVPWSWPVPAQEIGRLFTTPTERIQLDEARRQAQLPAIEPEVEPTPQPVARSEEPEPEPVVDRLTINGVVRRSSGPGTIWVNGAEVERGGRTRDGIVVQDTGRGVRGVRIRLPSGADTIELKPGQEIDVSSGAVLESYERRPTQGSAGSAFLQEGEPAGAQRERAVFSEASGEAGPAVAAEPPDSSDSAPEAMLRRLREFFEGGAAGRP